MYSFFIYYAIVIAVFAFFAFTSYASILRHESFNYLDVLYLAMQGIMLLTDGYMVIVFCLQIVAFKKKLALYPNLSYGEKTNKFVS
jgi:hypothetical protein